MKTIACAAAAALLAAGAAPADARGRWHHRHHDDVDAGDVVAGVAIVGGIAALASEIKQGNRAKQDAAVDNCADEAEYRGRGPVSEITHVSKRKGYYTVEGLLDGEESGTTAFTCTVRNGRIYSLRLGGEA
ncbi:hypothetical protein E2493_12005 [Sphingomonas parva]|uniref:Uncharacterized protein n=1 Tax=Sphingomonas parva TaxID=2555898 RepID=A0A4Y8ZPM1_9SPHN|nr:hypothetical protein [Sphingomonas parva]TFI57914.1 hypothetical protein E2493_12005 [Sphingomonas parva]